MKLILCLECKDTRGLTRNEWRQCECGNIAGRYNPDGDTVTIQAHNQDTCCVIGFPNGLFWGILDKQECYRHPWDYHKITLEKRTQPNAPPKTNPEYPRYAVHVPMDIDGERESGYEEILTTDNRAIASKRTVHEAIVRGCSTLLQDRTIDMEWEYTKERGWRQTWPKKRLNR